MQRTNRKRTEKIDRVLQMLEHIRSLGFEYTLSRPGRLYRLEVWTVQCGRYMGARCTGYWWVIENLLEAILMGYHVGRCHQKAETG
jgi:hypothetical protein